MLLVEDTSTSTFLIDRAHTRTDGMNLTNIWDNLNSARNESYWYTASNRLQNADGIWGALTYYYDGVGNRTYEILDDGSTTTTNIYSYASTDNRVQGVMQGSATVRAFTYDGAGNVTADDRGGTVYHYRYNNRGRLDQLTIGSTVTADYTYDGLERMAVRTTQNMTPAGTTHYVYDRAGHLIAEADDTGATVREYVWLDDMPLAVVADVDTATPHLYYVHVDHLNRPIMMTDAAKTVVWNAVYRPFGEAVSITGPASNNLRFPGQYFLIEDGLAYNWHRHYDATTGRYLQPDPLGFADRPSLFAYAQSSPLIYTDPSGLDVTVCFYPSTVGHVGFAVEGENTTYGFYPKKGTSNFFGGPGAVYPDIQPDRQYKVIRSPPEKDQCMLRCRSSRERNPGAYNLVSRQCTSFVRGCLRTCGISAGSSSSPVPFLFFRGLLEQ